VADFEKFSQKGALRGKLTKTPPCPKCGSTKTALIFYGYPADMEWYLKAVAKKEIIPGGCTIGENDPQLECTDCKWRWSDEDDEDYPYTESQP